MEALERVVGELPARGGSVVIVTHDLINLNLLDTVVDLDD